MPKFAPVASLSVLQQLWNTNCLGDYHLLLAHEVLKEPGMWADFYRKQRQFLGCRPFVIMDNSLIELGTPIEPEQLIQAVNVVEADVLVLPDYLTEHRATVDASVSASELLRPHLPKGCRLMGVVQGLTEDEYMKCADELLRFAKANLLAIPRVTTQTLGSRIFISYDIASEYAVHTHMLGFSDSIIDDICATICTPYCLGIDSSVPIRLGMEGVIVNTVASLTKGASKRPADWLDSSVPRQVTFEVQDNLRRLRGMIGCEQANTKQILTLGGLNVDR